MTSAGPNNSTADSSAGVGSAGVGSAGVGSVVVVGGGIVGLACAHYLIEAGHSVSVIDRGKIGSGCSHGNLGYICASHVLPLNEPGVMTEALISVLKPSAPLRIKPQLRFGFYRWLFEFARRCRHESMLRAGYHLQALLESSLAEYKRLFETYGRLGQYSQTGLAYVFESRAGFESFAKTDTLLSETYGVSARRIEGSKLIEFDPALRSGLAGGFFYPDDVSVRPEALIADWRELLERAGVVFRQDCEVRGVVHKADQVTGLETAAGVIRADSYVFAGGAWSVEFGGWLDCRLPVEPGKGYSITLDRPDSCPVHPILFPEHRIGVAGFEQGLRIGSMMEFVGFDDSLLQRRVDQLAESASTYLKLSPGVEIRQRWFGWRPMTWDSLPIIGPVPGFSNAVLATGHNMLGVALAAVSGRLVAELLEGHKPHLDITAFSPTRFGS